MSACDLGFLTRCEMLDRLERAFDSLDRMSRVHGHFYNWYDLSDLRVLDPPYVSTVDSGNLAGHLVALAQGCIAFADGPVDDARLWSALDADGNPAQRAATLSADAQNSRAMDQRAAPGVQSATVDIRRRASARGDVTRSAATTLWARQRLDAAADELSQLQLDAEEEVGDDASRRVANVVRRGVARRSAGGACAVAHARWRWRWTSDSCTIRAGVCSRSATTRAPAQLDESSYDLLASESRLASFIADREGRRAGGALVSPRSLAHRGRAARRRSCRGAAACSSISCRCSSCRRARSRCSTRRCHSAVRRQIAYGRARGVPWGISESAYNVRDRHDTYQYRAFGVPDLALKRGLATRSRRRALRDGACAPPSMRTPRCSNFSELEQLGALGEYGFYDALDYTRVAERRTRCDRANLHGAPRRDEPRRARPTR